MARDTSVAWFNEETNEVHTPKGRLVYPNLLTPKGIKDDPSSKPKFGLTLLIPKGANFDALKKLAGDAATEKFGAKRPAKLRSPFLKTEDQERLRDLAAEFPVLIRPSANTDFPPFIFGPDAKRHTGDASDIYGGRWAICTVRAYGYDTAGNKGVAFGLQRVQLLDHDEPIGGGRIETASGFDAVAVKGGKATASDMFDDGANATPKAAGAKDLGLDDEIPF